MAAYEAGGPERRLVGRSLLGALVGVDLADPGFWDSGLDLVERQLLAAEDAAREARGVTI